MFYTTETLDTNSWSTFHLYKWNSSCLASTLAVNQSYGGTERDSITFKQYGNKLFIKALFWNRCYKVLHKKEGDRTTDKTQLSLGVHSTEIHLEKVSWLQISFFRMEQRRDNRHWSDDPRVIWLQWLQVRCSMGPFCRPLPRAAIYW